MKWILICVLSLALESRCLAAEPKAEMLRLHNSARPFPYVVDSQLESAAQGYADWLNRNGGTGHYADGSDPSARIVRAGYQWSTWAENMAWAGSDPSATFAVWRGSPGHWSNIRNETFRDIGLGQSGRYWVACFGCRRDGPVLPPIVNPGNWKPVRRFGWRWW